jgi:hypothetical protein
MSDTPPRKPPAPIRARRWTPPPSSQPRPYRMALRLIGIPVVAVCGVLIYQGLRDHFVLPPCDSERARHSLSDVLKQLRLEPVRYEPIKTVSSTKDTVVCNAVLPLPDGGNVVADFTFYWEGNTAHMKYSVSRQRS